MRLPFLLIAALFLVISSYQAIDSKPTGTPQAASGGPAEGTFTCTQPACHGGNTPQSVNNYITHDIPSSGYVPGKAYNFTVSFSGTGNKGFQLSAQDSVGNSKGSFIAGSGSKLNTFGAVGYITHTAAKGTTAVSWTFQWRAPQRGSKRFSIWGAFAITTSITKRQNFFLYQNPTLPIVTTLAPTSVSHQAAMVAATANANTGAYNVSFQYKPEGGNWSFINALPASIGGDTTTPLKITFTGLAPNTRYIYRASAWNVADTTWGDTLSFTTLNTGIEDQLRLEGLSVYPQPASDQLNVSFNLNSTSDIQLEILNLSGSRVYTIDNGKLPAGNNQLSVPLDLKNGIYLLRLSSDKQSVTRKIIIQ